MTASTEELAQRLARLERQVASGTVNQLGLSSFEGGGITQYSSDGSTVIARYGEQFDGTSGAVLLNGPRPPQPLAPRLTPALGGFEVFVSGGFVPDGSGTTVIAPMDFRAFAIHLSKDGPNFIPSQSTFRYSVVSASGGTVFVTATPENEWYCKIICVSEAGVLSAPSLGVGPVRATGVSPEDLAFDPEDFAGTTIHYGPISSPPTVAVAGDVWLAETAAGPPAKYVIKRYTGDAWVDLQDQGTADSLAAAIAAQQAAALKARVIAQPSQPTGLTTTDKVIWIDTDAGNRMWSWNGTGWDDLRLGNGAIQPQSLIASDVIATGTISAALLEAILVLATTVVSGDPSGVHVRMTPTGFRVYRTDAATGLPEEVARLGTETNDYFAIIDGDGLLVANIDDTGAVNGRTANFREDITVAGLPLATSLLRLPQGQVGRWTGAAPAGLDGSGAAPGIRSEYGIAQFTFPVVAGRTYMVTHYGPERYITNGGEIILRLRNAMNATVTLTSPMLAAYYENSIDTNFWQLKPYTATYYATTTGQASIGLTIEHKWPVDATSCARVPAGSAITFEAYDMGYAGPGSAGQVTAMGGQLYGGAPPAPPPPVVQQINTGWMAPAGWQTFNGARALRTDTTEVVQGWDPSGYNGDGFGWWWWNLPEITGTVDSVWIWLQSNHWYYNSGGTARLWPIKAGGGAPAGLTTGVYDVPGFPKPGSVQTDISGWKHLFHSNQGAERAIGIQVGPGGGTDLTYYGRFGGPQARLGIRYTQ